MGSETGQSALTFAQATGYSVSMQNFERYLNEN